MICLNGRNINKFSSHLWVLYLNFKIEKKQIDGLEVSDKEKSITDEQKNNIYYPLQSISPSTNESNGGNEEVICCLILLDKDYFISGFNR